MYKNKEALTPSFKEKNGVIVDVTKSFCMLSDFTSEELVGIPFSTVWSSLLRINTNPIPTETTQQAFLFTKHLEARCVTVKPVKNNTTAETDYYINEIPNSRFEDRNIYIEQLCKSDFVGVAVYSVPDMILIKANQAYLDFLEPPFNQKEISIGRKIEQIITGWKRSPVEQCWAEAINTGKPVQVKEYEHKGYKKGLTYWESIITTIPEDGNIKYAVSTTHKMTERIDITGLMEKEKQNKFQKDMLEDIMNNIQENMIVFDRTGKILFSDKETKQLMLNIVDRMAHFYKTTKVYNMKGKEILVTDSPLFRALHGETAKDEIFYYDWGGKRYYEIFGAKPILDEKGSFLYGIFYRRDMTEIFHSQHALKETQERLLQAEREKNDALEASIKMKDDFLYLITHEFRTPMAVVNSALQAIELMYNNEVSLNIRKHLNTIKQNTNRQLRLVNNLLDITRINSGHIKLNKSNIDVAYVTKAIVDSVELYAKQKKISLNFISSISRKLVYLDEEKYERILLNLLANALKFTAKGKSITVSLSAKKRNDRSLVCISVQDEGIGIPKDKLEVIFERFGQADTSLSRQAEGTGLGLYLVRMLLNAMEGEITVESVEGKGSTFIVTFPVTKPSVFDLIASENSKRRLSSDDNRIIHAASIEFSDIYFD